ncbi:MAG: DUF5011 domain-containing protein, partial [Anaeroplasmataceae bacterium]|nr:DUF5011 domain-containing protein [Anaeroplasmataceae bacterium]
KGAARDRDNFKGDFDYYHQTSGTEYIDIQKIRNELDMEDFDFFLPVINELTDFLSKEDIKLFGIHAVNVLSYAVFHTDDYLIMTCFGGQRKAPNTDCTISGNMTHFVDVNHPTSLNDIKARYHATDNVDGDITSRLSFETNYNPQNLKVGTYYLIVYVYDKAGHKTLTADLIRVKDFTAPTISLSKTEHTIEVHSNFTLEDAKKFFSATDNFTPQNQIQWKFEDNYKNQFNTLGTYTITATAKDSDGNTSSKTLTIHVKDTTKPTISLLTGGDTIYADHVLSDSEIKALLKVTDNYYTLSNTQINIIENTCTGAQGKEYRLKVSIMDGSNNVGEQIFKYYLLDTEYPIITVEKTLYIPMGYSYTNEQIIQMLQDAGILDAQTINVSLNSYEGISTTDEGIYEISYIETLEDGSIKEGKIKLNVFSPAEHPTEDLPASQNNSWYFFLLLLPVGVAVVGVLIKNKKHEKE